MKQTRTKIMTGLVSTLACVGMAHGQSNDALLNKLVDKGILTAKEAEEMKKESDNKKIVTTGLGMPDWVTGVKIYGDIRGRMDLFDFENDTKGLPNQERIRYRVRARAGLTVSFKDNLELGVRLTTADADSGSSASLGQGGNSLSGNTTLQNNGSKKYTFIDLAYGKWSPIKNDNWMLTATIGKMENPFTFSDLVFDNDYTPEGAALSLSYKVNDMHSLKLTGGAFVIDEVSSGKNANSDPILVGLQARWDAKWNKSLESSLGVAALSLSDTENLGNGAVPNTNLGNTRHGGTNSNAGLLVNNYNPLVADAAVTYWIEQMPCYKGRFPIRVFGTAMLNPSARDDNFAWEAGFGIGKAGKKGTWELTYRYRFLEHDAQYEEFVDDDFGAFYAGGVDGSGKGAGFGAGTNVKGHTVKASYSPYDAIIFSITYFRAQLIDSVPQGSESDTGRLFVDATWKF